MSESRKNSGEVSDDLDKISGRKKSIIANILSASRGRLFGSNTSLSDTPCNIHLLDDRCMTVSVTNKTSGRCLLEVVCERLQVLPFISYFGLRYTDHAGLTQWIDLDERMNKQLKDVQNSTFCFRVIYYPSDPLECFTDDKSKYLFYLQLRRDFYVGRLRAHSLATYQLAAYAIQAEHGLQQVPDRFDITHIPGGMRVLPVISSIIINRVQDQLKKILKISKSEAVDKFISLASNIETYGMEPFQVEDQRHNGLCIGFNHRGISIFKDEYSVNAFRWSQIKSVYPAKKNVIFILFGHHLAEEKDIVLGFKCKSFREAKTLAQRALHCKNFLLEEESSHINQIAYRRSSILAYRPPLPPKQDSLSDSSDSLHCGSTINSNPNPSIDIQLDKTEIMNLPEISDTRYEWPSLDSYENSFNQNIEISRNNEIQNNKSQTELSPSSTTTSSSYGRLNSQRHSLAIPLLDLPPIGHQRISPRNSIGGSMELCTPTAEKKPQVSDLSWKSKNPYCLLNSSSINLNERKTQEEQT